MSDSVMSGLVAALVGALVVCVGVLGWLERLPRNGFVGVRTKASMESDRAFRAANRAAAPWMVGAGIVVLIGGGVAAPLADSHTDLYVLGGVAVMILLTLVGAVRGHRAARRLGDP
ncbi:MULTISPECIES: SdpI family protein [Actinomadura]|uniref:SdpI family protein n=1 Tax=Actinomadura miaoliensis TaxID=430685 RepID=A0ABP7VNJ4_9ACTN